MSEIIFISAGKCHLHHSYFNVNLGLIFCFCFKEIIVPVIKHVCPDILPAKICDVLDSVLKTVLNVLKDHSSAKTFCQEHNCEVNIFIKKESLFEINA